MEGLKGQISNSLGNRKTKKASKQSNKIKAIFYEKQSDNRMGKIGNKEIHWQFAHVSLWTDNERLKKEQKGI